MNLHLQKSNIISNCAIRISGSKSETNRLLILQALFPNISLKNVSNSDDTKVLIKALSSNEETINIHHAGTAMRFLTAYFAIQPGKTITLTGSSRMKERPIKILVDALRQIGADIEYLGHEGFPPIKITGKKTFGNKVTLHANVSSQYISALMLIAPKLESGLEIILEGKITSMPYLQLTMHLLNKIGVTTNFTNNTILVFPTPNTQHPTPITIESDWSSASYFYSIIALAKAGTTMTLSTFNKESHQGDRALAEIYEDLHVNTKFENNTIVLTKINNQSSYNSQQPADNRQLTSGKRQPLILNLQLNDNPDLAQTIAVTCFGLGIGCELSGLHTLRIKETDRLTALQTELTKLGAKVTVTNDSLMLDPSDSINTNIKINTYGDHRMAMAFAPLAQKVPITTIEDAAVVSKSYPDFWNDLKTIGFQVSDIQ